MKEKLLRANKIIVSTICAMVFSFAPIFNIPFVFKAQETEYIAKWNASEELLDSIKNLNGGVPQNAMFMYESKYFGRTGIKSSSYSSTGSSFIYGISDTGGQNWKSQIVISKDNFYIQSASQDAKGVAFTAPAPGIYKIIPEGIGNIYPDYSVYATKGNWSFEILNGTKVIYQATINAETGIKFDEIEVTLEKDDVIRLNYYAPGYTNYGYTVYSNFSIGLVEEFKSQVPINPQYSEKVYNASDCLTTLTSTKFTTDYSIVPFSAVCGSYDQSVTEWTAAIARKMDSYYWFAHTQMSSWGDTGYYVRAYPDNNIVHFGTKNIKYLAALVFTAPNDGTYTFYGDNIKQNGSAGFHFYLMNDNNEILVTLTNSSVGGKLNYTVDLKAGQKIYYYFSKSSSNSGDYTSGGIEFNNFKVISKELVGYGGYDEGYIYTKTKEEYLEQADINQSEEGNLEISFKGGNLYNYEVFFYENGAFKALEQLDNGRFLLFNIYKDCVDLCFKAYDDQGNSAEYYLTYVYKTEYSYSFKINDKSVYDIASVDVSSGGFDISVSGKNLSTKYDGKALELVGNKARIVENKNGVHLLEFVFGDYAKRIKIVTFNAAVNYNQLVAYITLNDNEFRFYAYKQNETIYSYAIESFDGVSVYFNSKMGNNDKTTVDKFGIYNASIGIKNDDNGQNSSLYNKRFEIKRPGGEWNLNVKVADSSEEIVYASVGSTVEVVAESTFGGSVLDNTYYAFYMKSGDSFITIKDYSDLNSAEFVPEGSGVYDIYVTAKGDDADSAEVYKNIKVVVADDAYNGGVSIKNYSFNGVGKTALIEAEATPSTRDEIFFRFYAVYHDDIVLIKDYSLDNFVEFIPTRPEHFNVLVEVRNQNSLGAYDVSYLYEYQHTCSPSEAYSLEEYSCDDTYAVTICSVCGKQISVTPLSGDSHDYGEWEIVKNPSFIKEGVKKRVCKTHSEHVETASVECPIPTEQDVEWIAKYISGYDVEIHPYGDMNDDGVIDIGDLVLLKLYIEGYELEF